MKKLRILIADDHGLVRRGARPVFQSYTLRRGVDSGAIEETARIDESYSLIPPKHLGSCQIGGSR
jgi:hypothetical protein